MKIRITVTLLFLFSIITYIQQKKSPVNENKAPSVEKKISLKDIKKTTKETSYAKKVKKEIPIEHPFDQKELSELDPEDNFEEHFARYYLGPKHLRAYFNIKKKVLFNANDQESIQAELSNPVNIDKSFESLKTASNDFNEIEERDRILAIKFIKGGIRWKYNPMRMQFLDEARNYLQNFEVNSEASIQTKKSVIGDKIEVFRLLNLESPDLAENIFNSASDKDKKIYEYAINNKDY